ncbi:MAG: FtsW/RodA/SpoVE family cell cycle protein [Hungatella sp.]|nr:FtsW/RodA/SpoVE family cell cycle protein [Hungatella sp.]
MANMIADISKYLMILLIAMYTFWNFRYFGVREERRPVLAGRQNRIMYLLHFLAYAVMFLKTGEEKLLVFYGAQAVFFLCYLFFYRRFYRNHSHILVNNMCILLCVGFIILTRLSFERAVRQFVLVVFSAAVTLVIPFIIDRVWQLSRIPWVYGGLGAGLLGAVYLVGDDSYGAQLSLTVRGISVQPSEFVKIIFVFFVATMFYRSTEKRQVIVTTAAAGIHILILALSKDLGSALIFFASYVFMLFIATSDWRYLGGGVIGGALASLAGWALFSHVRVRVAVWADPWADIDNKGYQITQSLFAIGTGSWFGMGLYQGMPGKIPVVEKDFVLAAVSEEMGALFAFCVLLICVGCFIQFMMIACRMDAMFYKLIAVGLASMYIAQVFLTAGGACKFIPSTGVTLPFVSYGGSSMMSTFIVFSVIQGMYILKRDEEEEYGTDC